VYSGVDAGTACPTSTRGRLLVGQDDHTVVPVEVLAHGAGGVGAATEEEPIGAPPVRRPQQRLTAAHRELGGPRAGCLAPAALSRSPGDESPVRYTLNWMIQPARLDLRDAATVQELWELQRQAYAVEAELIGYDGIPPLHESPDQLRSCGESFLGLYQDGRLTGAVAWRRLDDATLDICRLVVHPPAHRSGIATSLLDALDALEPADRTIVSTGTGNIPALTLYRRRGFVPTADREIAPGVTVTLLERVNGR
jgi:GNAT superfamily N-acetyltransferase